LNAYFSENTRELAKMLGYDPASFSELKKTSLATLLSQKKIPFGEFVLLSSSSAPSLKEVFTSYAKNLTSQQVSTSLLNQRARALGEDLEGVEKCLDKIGGHWEGEESLEPRFFGGDQPMKVTPREIRFLQFATAGLSYLTQSMFEYDWGFEVFPLWPPQDSFYQDINGQLGSGDRRFGDLDEEGAAAIVAHGPLLKETFQNFDLFLKADGVFTPIDQWLAWRFTSDSLKNLREILEAADGSLSSGTWVRVSDSDESVSLASLLSASTLPDASQIGAGIDLLVKDQNKNPTVNLTYLTELLKNLVAKK